jgi:hypothetical protein
MRDERQVRSNIFLRPDFLIPFAKVAAAVKMKQHVISYTSNLFLLFSSPLFLFPFFKLAPHTTKKLPNQPYRMRSISERENTYELLHDAFEKSSQFQLALACLRTYLAVIRMYVLYY